MSASAHLPIMALGFLGQSLFGVRTLVQWVASERQGRSVVPASYWTLTTIAALILCAYAALDQEWVLLPGWVVSLGLALRNLALQRGTELRIDERVLVPAFAILLPAALAAAWFQVRKQAPDLPAAWLAVGVVGQGIWTTRYLVQWWSSEKRGQSVLPASFWWLSIAGAVLLTCYCLRREEWVGVIAFAINPIPYSRNLLLMRRAAAEPAREAVPA